MYLTDFAAEILEVCPMEFALYLAAGFLEGTSRRTGGVPGGVPDVAP